MDIRRLDQKQIHWIYETYMIIDFPQDELKPRKVIDAMMVKGIYECLGFYQDEELVAYACFVKHSEQKTLLLDYYAVCPAYRSSGVGSEFLQQMKTFFVDCDAMILESESVSGAGDDAEQTIRSRRIRFYIRNGCQKSLVKSRLFGVEYDILWLPLRTEKIDVKEALAQLYRLMFPPELFGARVQIWERHGGLKTALRFDERLGKLEEKKSLLSALGLLRNGQLAVPPVISLVGAGGKTTTMYQLADELAEQGCRVLVTTSTHIGCPRSGWVLKDKTLAEAAALTWEADILTIGTAAEADKLAAPADLGDEKAMAAVLKVVDVILIEADGSKQHPLKVPADWEPVLLKQTEMVIACAGLTAIHQTFADGCFRIDSHGGWLHRGKDDMVTGADVALVLMDERGCRKKVTDLPDYRYQIILNQADEEPEEMAMPVIRLLPVIMRHGCVVTSYERD